MKIYILTLFLFGSLVVPTFSFAQQTDVDPLGNGCAIITHNLRYGMKDTAINNDVSVLQNFLNSQGYLNVSTTGFFGSKTLAAVKLFQSRNSLSVTGYVGTYTREKIKAISCDGLEIVPTPVPHYEDGCTSAYGYNSITGQKCSGISVGPASTPIPAVSYTAGCTSVWGYSITTGLACDGSQTSNIIFLSGCTSTRGFSTTTGQACDGSNTIQPIYPSGCLSNFGYSSITGLACDGSQIFTPTTPTPTLVVTSPNGGETFMAGQQINVKWSTTGFTSNAYAAIGLVEKIGDVYSTVYGLTYGGVINDGSEMVTIPYSIKSGTNYIIIVNVFEGRPNVMYNQEITDHSDAPFTINTIPIIPTTIIADSTNTCGTDTSVTINGTTYSLNPSSLTDTMIDGSGNKNFNVTVVPSDPNALYGVSFYGSGVGFPTYGILGTASGGARGTTTFSKYFNDSVLSADGTQSRVYSGCLPVHIFEGSEAGNNFAYFNLNLTVNP